MSFSNTSDLPPQAYTRSMGYGPGGFSVVQQTKVAGTEIRGLPLAGYVFEQPSIVAAGTGFESPLSTGQPGSWIKERPQDKALFAVPNMHQSPADARKWRNNNPYPGNPGNQGSGV